MFEISEADPKYNVFSEACRPLKIENINNGPRFAPISTRIPSIQAIREKRKEFTQTITEREIQDIHRDQAINPNDISQVESDHFQRDFARLSLPVCRQKRVPPVTAPVQSQKVKPNWHCDVPTTNMKPQKKITYHDVVESVLVHELPTCSCCGNKVHYPFYASPEYQVCEECYSHGKLPNYKTTRDFFVINKATDSDGSWTLSETNKLLSFIEEYGDDWQTVSAQMKNRSPSECLLHFVRLPIIDQYYCDDISAVQEEQDDMTPVLPFMMAPHPIATYVEFIHLVNHKLGCAVAEISQKIIEERLKANSSMIPFTQVPEILGLIIKATKKEAEKIAYDEAETAAEMISSISRKLHIFVIEEFKQLEIKVKQNDSKASELEFSVPAEGVPIEEEEEEEVFQQKEQKLAEEEEEEDKD